MNLKKMFETQRALDEAIIQKKGLQDQDLLPQKILALQVELGECANEWRGFKFWSEDQKARTKKKIICHSCKGIGEFHHQEFNGVSHIDDNVDPCLYCEGTGLQEDINPLLEEYADCLHFILSIGLRYRMEDIYEEEVNFSIGGRTKRTDALDNFELLFRQITRLYTEEDYIELLSLFATLGDSLGFTEQQIEEAYFAKNKVNHERQENGY